MNVKVIISGIVILAFSMYSCDWNKPLIIGSQVTDFPIIDEDASLPIDSTLKKSMNVSSPSQFKFHAYSSPNNAIPSNGEWRSDNVPKPVTSAFKRNGIYLTAATNQFVKYDDQHIGNVLFLVNTSDSSLVLDASDSYLYMQIEAQNKRQKWQAISEPPYSYCGNSFHTIILDKEEYWTFPTPIFAGTFKTKIRYVLHLGKDRILVSNEVSATINPSQFVEE